MTMPALYDAAAVRGALPWEAAIAALDEALAAGLDPAAGPLRSRATLSAGELLLMPAEAGEWAGVKVLSVAGGNPGRGLPAIQGLYLLCDAETLTPRALLDGAELTLRRTAALTALALRHLASPDARRLVVFGTGPQARAHIEAVSAVLPIEEVELVGRTPARCAVLCEELTRPDRTVRPAEVGAVAGADVIVCATSAIEPLFGADLLPQRVAIGAMGAHRPGEMELGLDVLRKADLIVVEDRATALAEAGDIMAAEAAGVLGAGDLVPLAEPRWREGSEGISVFRSVGMAWEDLVAAARAASGAECP